MARWRDRRQESGGPAVTALHIEVHAQRYQVVTTEDGIHTTPVGPKWDTPRQASAYIRTLSEIPQVPATRSTALAGDKDTPWSDAPSSGSPDSVLSRLDVMGDPLSLGLMP